MWLVFFYDLGVSCPDENSAIEIGNEFQHKTLLLSNQHSLTFKCGVSPKGKEWLIGIYPFGIAWERPETNVELLKDEVIEETGKHIYETLQSNPDWVYYYALFQAEAHDRTLEDELLTELLVDYKDDFIKKNAQVLTFRQCYIGLVLLLPLAQSLSIDHKFKKL